jgi:type II secretory pathway pseudopilin PulG
MAANIPQMVANGQMMMLQQQQQQQQQQLQQQQQQQQQHQHQQPQNKQLQNLVYTNLMQSMSVAPINSWQAGVSIGDRFAKTSNLYEALFLVFQSILVLLLSSFELCAWHWHLTQYLVHC